MGFRFKDRSDFIVTNQEIGVGDSEQTIFQLVKTYTSGKDEHIRAIKKPVYDTVKIYLNGQEDSQCSVDYSTGRIIFVKPPPKDTIITASFEFDVPVRFDTDYLSASIDNYGSNSCNNIPLVEVKL